MDQRSASILSCLVLDMKEVILATQQVIHPLLQPVEWLQCPLLVLQELSGMFLLGFGLSRRWLTLLGEKEQGSNLLKTFRLQAEIEARKEVKGLVGRPGFPGLVVRDANMHSVKDMKGQTLECIEKISLFGSFLRDDAGDGGKPLGFVDVKDGQSNDSMMYCWCCLSVHIVATSKQQACPCLR